MAKAILTTKVDPTYDDLPEERYHFPHTYLRQIEQVKGDWIIYYEPRRTSGNLSSSGGRQAYFAAARVMRIEKDSSLPNHYYAFVAYYFGRSLTMVQIQLETVWPCPPRFIGCLIEALFQWTIIFPFSLPKTNCPTWHCEFSMKTCS